MRKPFKQQARECKLKAPDVFWKLSEEELAEYGCGAGKSGDKFVPDSMYFLSIKVACIVHDLRWDEAANVEDVEASNIEFLVNLLKIINTYSKPVLKQLRRYRATTYYTAVEDVGMKSKVKEFES